LLCRRRGLAGRPGRPKSCRRCRGLSTAPPRAYATCCRYTSLPKTPAGRPDLFGRPEGRSLQRWAAVNPKHPPRALSINKCDLLPVCASATCSRLVGANGVTQPGAGVSPVSRSGCARNAQCLGGFLDAQPGKKTQLHELRLFRLLLTEP